MTGAVTKHRVSEAAKTLANASIAAVACREAGLPFFVACALLEKESGGKNVYGHDKGGALAGFPEPVNEENFKVFRWLVIDQRATSNGVGPTQITFRGYFPQMESEGLKAWDVHDNMLFGFRLLAKHFDTKGSWEAAGAAYNGSPAYGADLDKKIKLWMKRLGI